MLASELWLPAVRTVLLETLAEATGSPEHWALHVRHCRVRPGGVV